MRFEGAVGGPIADSLAARVAVLYDKSDGFVKNSVGPALLKDDTRAIRGQISVNLSDKLQIRVSADLYEIEPVTTGGAYITAAAPGGDGLGVALPAGSPTGFGYVPSSDPYAGSFDFPGRFTRSVSNAAARISYDFGAVTLSSITSYQRLTSEYIADNDFSPVPLAKFEQNASAHHITQELRLLGESDALRWTAGAYFLRIDGRYFQAFNVLPIGTEPKENHAVDTRSYSVFGQVELPLGERLRLTAGLRGTRDQKSYAYLEDCTGPACAAFLAPGSIGTAGLITDDHSENGLSGRLQADWQWSTDALLYASINRG